MSLIECAECKKENSDSASHCINCGRPMTAKGLVKREILLAIDWLFPDVHLPPKQGYECKKLVNTPLVFSVAVIIFLSMFPWAVGHKLCCYQYLTGKVMILFGILSIVYELRGGDSRNLSFTTALIAIILSNVIKGRDDDEWVTRDVKSTYTAVLAFLVAVASLYFSHLSVPYELERKPDVEQGN